MRTPWNDGPKILLCSIIRFGVCRANHDLSEAVFDSPLVQPFTGLSKKLILRMRESLSSCEAVPYIRLLTAAARVRAQVRSCAICGGQCGNGPGFLRLLLFPLPIVPLLLIHHRRSSGAGTVGQTVADVSSGLSLTPP
jgi:hypothetical protein